MNTFFTSDHHFCHKNIIKYCNRPFSSVEEMDANMIDAWNNVVGEQDIVYHLGDFTLGDHEIAQSIFELLKGKIKVLSNPNHHDKHWLKHEIHGRESVVEYLPPLITIEEFGVIVLCHFPLAEWDRKHYGSYHFHGHSHGNFRENALSFDVGVDSAFEKLGAYRPFSLEEAIYYAES